MDKKQITAAVNDVINEASRAKGWSLAKLTRYLGKGANTLHRWKTGQTNAYDMDALIKLFRIADISMDRAFGLSRPGAESGKLSDRQYASLRDDIGRIDKELAQLRPLARLTAAVAGIVTALNTDVDPGPEDDPPGNSTDPPPPSKPKRARARTATLGNKLAEAQAKNKAMAKKRTKKGA
jgi:transcriptional regulator with XRE-family HTH domain